MSILQVKTKQKIIINQTLDIDTEDEWLLNQIIELFETRKKLNQLPEVKADSKLDGQITEAIEDMENCLQNDKTSPKTAKRLILSLKK
jgi:hypothetical protein